MDRQKAALVGKGNESVPLTGVAIACDIACGHARVGVKQSYKNAGSKPIEAVYTFPLSAEATLSGFKMTCAGRTVEGEIQERQKAFLAYDEALTKGHGAALLEEERANVFTASVGNILPGEDVTIEIEYVERLFAEEGALRFVLPTLVAPRYIPGHAQGNREGHGTADPTDRVPDADRISPPMAQDIPYKLSLALTLDVGANVVVESPSHKVKVTDVGALKKVELVSASEEGAPLDRDFVLLVSQANAGEAVSVVCHREPQKQGYFALTVVPDLFDPNATTGKNTCVFVLDRSGSMQGSAITEARTALKLCLRQLREGDEFNILAFDNTVEPFWTDKRLVPFTARTLAEADAWIDTVSPRGGTELMGPLEEAVQSAPDGIVVLLTDGEVGNEAEILARITGLQKKTRIYSFGIGTNVSTALLLDLARATGGACDSIYPGERIDDKVVAQFSRATAARISDVTVTLEGVDASELAPSTPRSLVDGEPWTMFGVYETSSVGRAIIRGKKGGETYALNVPLILEGEANAPFVRRLWAKERVRELENASLDGRRAEANAARIVALCVENRIVSKLASFVVVEKREGDRRTSTPAETQVVPVNLPAGWAMFDAKPHVNAARVRSTGMHSIGAAGGAPPMGGAYPPPPSRSAVLSRPMAAPQRPSAQASAPPMVARGMTPFAQSPVPMAPAMVSSPSMMRPMEPMGPREVEPVHAPPTDDGASSAAKMLATQGASGLFSENLGAAIACEKTVRALTALFADGIEAGHSVYGAQIKKAVAALLKEAPGLDSALRARVLVCAWLVSGRRTRAEVLKQAIAAGVAEHVTTEDAARAFLRGGQIE